MAEIKKPVENPLMKNTEIEISDRPLEAKIGRLIPDRITSEQAINIEKQKNEVQERG